MRRPKCWQLAFFFSLNLLSIAFLAQFLLLLAATSWHLMSSIRFAKLCFLIFNLVNSSKENKFIFNRHAFKAMSLKLPVVRQQRWKKNMPDYCYYIVFKLIFVRWSKIWMDLQFVNFLCRHRFVSKRPSYNIQMRLQRQLVTPWCCFDLQQESRLWRSLQYIIIHLLMHWFGKQHSVPVDSISFSQYTTQWLQIFLLRGQLIKFTATLKNHLNPMDH